MWPPLQSPWTPDRTECVRFTCADWPSGPKWLTLPTSSLKARGEVAPLCRWLAARAKRTRPPDASRRCVCDAVRALSLSAQSSEAWTSQSEVQLRLHWHPMGHRKEVVYFKAAFKLHASCVPSLWSVHGICVVAWTEWMRMPCVVSPVQINGRCVVTSSRRHVVTYERRNAH